MKLLEWAARLSRRSFLASGVATIATVAVGGTNVLADPASPSADQPGLSTDESRTLLLFTRDLFPHDRLDDSFYAIAIAPLQQEAAKDSSTRDVLSEGVARLNRLAIAAGGKPYADLSDETSRAGVIGQMESSPFFRKVYDTTIVSLYNQPEVWPKFGYQGPSSAQGGYLHRGFDDLNWVWS